jgi:AraC-like DNA-binding protein
MSTVIGYIEYGTDVTIDIDASVLNSYSISLPISGEQELRRPNGLLMSDSENGIIVSTVYLKRFRLEAVRQALLEGGCSGNITAVAMQWGFNHLGRFSSDYKKLFLEVPSKTVERSRKH